MSEYRNFIRILAHGHFSHHSHRNVFWAIQRKAVAIGHWSRHPYRIADYVNGSPKFPCNVHSTTSAGNRLFDGVGRWFGSTVCNGVSCNIFCLWFKFENYRCDSAPATLVGSKYALVLFRSLANETASLQRNWDLLWVASRSGNVLQSIPSLGIVNVD